MDEKAILAFLDDIVKTEMQDLEKNGREIETKMQNLTIRFKAACDQFENLSSEPNTEEIYMPNVNSIKSQKRAYAGVLNNIIETKIVDKSISNPYEKYAAMLTTIADVKNRVLKTNTAFKQVIYAYAENTKEFKNMIFEMEKYEIALGNSVVKNRDKYDKYIKVRDIASRLLDVSTEILQAQESTNNVAPDIKKVPEEGLYLRKKELLGEIDAKNIELSKLRKEIFEMKAVITSMLMPLHKASKKFDHKSNGKLRLSDYILDPIGHIVDEASLNDMIGMLKALKEELLLGELGTRPISDMAESIDAIISYNMLLTTTAIRRLMSDEQKVIDETRKVQAELNSINLAEEQISKIANDAKRRAEYIDELKGRRVKIVSDLESAFEKQYNKRIKIV